MLDHQAETTAQSAPAAAASLDKISALCKRRGFIFQSAEIYGGLNGVYDTGPLGVALKDALKRAWKEHIQRHGTIYFMEGALLGPQAMWVASGHVENFHDPMVDCLHCRKRYRADELDLNKPCPHCGNKGWTAVRQFNMMFSTNVGATEGTTGYLRPETAQSLFVNFKNVLMACRAKLPFGIAQVGKAFRNEITPKQFLFRMREFEQMEIEWFCKGENAQDEFQAWCNERLAFYDAIGIRRDHIRMRAHGKDELSHYSSATSDIEFLFPFGWKELEGIAYRGNFDLTQHMKHSGKELAVFDEASKTSVVPHVVECSVGLDRLFLAVLCHAYDEDVIDGETRIVLRLAPKLAPITAAILPLVKDQNEAAEKLYKTLLQQGFAVTFDPSGSIGKRYRRYDEIGTPLCITYDFDSAGNQTVTIRDRDTTKQERVAISDLPLVITKLLQ
jgi:glycyl-tRNA synthetase